MKKGNDGFGYAVLRRKIYECKEKFMLGFRLGARFVLDTFVMPRYNELNCEYEEI